LKQKKVKQIILNIDMKNSILCFTIANLFALTLFTANNASAQFSFVTKKVDKFTVADDCLYKAYYYLQFYPYSQKYSVNSVGSEQKASNYEEDITVVEIGKNVIHSGSYTFYKSDSSSTAKSETRSMRQVIFPEDVFIYPQRKVLSLAYRTWLGVAIYRYEEPIEKFNWKITQQIDTIAGYECQSATCTFRGREYTAWFTKEVPVNAGPYKFRGLPGLIVKLYDKMGDYCWTLSVFVKAPSGETIKNYTWQYTNTTKAKYNNAIKWMYDDPYQFFGSFGMKFMVNSGNGFSPNHAKVTIPYNPIELSEEKGK